MSNYFTKYKKSATALALVFAVSYSASVSASNIHYQGQDIIDENADSLNALNGGRFVLSRGNNIGIDGVDDPNPHNSIEEVVPYDLGINVARNDLQSVKNSVIQSPLLTYPELYEDHQNSFKQKIVTAYNNTPLRDCHNFLDHARDLSVKLFKVSQNQLSKSKNRNEWAEDDTLGGFFTFTLNNNQKVSILVKDLSIVLPLYSNHRHPDLNSMAPWVEPQDGLQLTADQRITSQFINRILSGEIPGDPLKRGIKFRLQNRTGLTLDELVNRFTGRNLPLQIQGVEDRERSFLRGLIDTWQEGEKTNPNPARILDYIRNTRNSPLLVKYPALAFEVGQKIVVKRKAEFTNQTEDQERLLLQTLIYKWQEGEKTNPNPARILDYIRNIRNSPFLVKYPDFAVEVGKKIVARRKEEINYYL